MEMLSIIKQLLLPAPPGNMQQFEMRALPNGAPFDKHGEHPSRPGLPPGYGDDCQKIIDASQ